MHTSNAVLTCFIAASVSAISFEDEAKPSCCPPSQEVIHVDDKKHDDHQHDDHAGHDHGGGVFDVVKKQGTLNTLAAALGQAELEETLSHDEWTVFAPTDEAFAQLPPDKLDMLLQPANKEKLKSLLMAHVVKGVVGSAAVTRDSNSVESVQGSSLQVTRTADGKVMVNSATVVEADVVATNGVIHTIDAVIIPPGLLD